MFWIVPWRLYPWSAKIMPLEWCQTRTKQKRDGLGSVGAYTHNINRSIGHRCNSSHLHKHVHKNVSDSEYFSECMFRQGWRSICAVLTCYAYKVRHTYILTDESSKYHSLSKTTYHHSTLWWIQTGNYVSYDQETDRPYSLKGVYFITHLLRKTYDVAESWMWVEQARLCFFCVSEHQLNCLGHTCFRGQKCIEVIQKSSGKRQNAARGL